MEQQPAAPAPGPEAEPSKRGESPAEPREAISEPTKLLRIASMVIEARVPLACPLGRRRIGTIEIINDGSDRRVEAVEIHSVDANAAALRELGVAGAQPADELEHGGVAPHPGRKTGKAGERLRPAEFVYFETTFT